MLKSKKIIKDKGSYGGKRVNPKEIVRKATSNMNKKIMPMYDVAPETIFKKSWSKTRQWISTNIQF